MTTSTAIERPTLLERIKTDPVLLAHQLADAAACMDWLRREFSRIAADDVQHAMLATESERHVEWLHKIAAALAGDRAHEIYAPEDTQPATTNPTSGVHHADHIAM